jgi:hypothetical protein
MTYKKWAEKAVSEYTCEFGRGAIRDIYTLPNGIRIHDEVFFPRNPFQSQHQQTLVDYVFPKSRQAWLKEQGADLDTDRYTEEGFGYPLFRGETSTERAFNFAMNLKEKI